MGGGSRGRTEPILHCPQKDLLTKGVIDDSVTLSRTRQTGEQGTGSWEWNSFPFPIPGSLLPAHQFSDRVIDHTP